MAILQTPPKRGSYSFVLTLKRDIALIQPQAFCSYDETTDSRAIEFGGKKKHTLFLRTKTGFERAIRTGWQDITEDWIKAVEAKITRPTSDAQVELLRVMADFGIATWRGKKAIMLKADIPDSAWRTAVQYLEKKKLIACNKAMGTKARTDGPKHKRDFMYRITKAGLEAIDRDNG